MTRHTKKAGENKGQTNKYHIKEIQSHTYLTEEKAKKTKSMCNWRNKDISQETCFYVVQAAHNTTENA